MTGPCFVSILDLEGRTDDKIRIMEQVEELRLKRADRQVQFPFLLSPFNRLQWVDTKMCMPIPNRHYLY